MEVVLDRDPPKPSEKRKVGRGQETPGRDEAADCRGGRNIRMHGDEVAVGCQGGRNIRVHAREQVTKELLRQ